MVGADDLKGLSLNNSMKEVAKPAHLGVEDGPASFSSAHS